MLIAASTECFSSLPLRDVLGRLVDLEFVNVEIRIDEQGNHLKPTAVAEDLEGAVDICRNTNRLNVVSYDVHINAQGEEYYRQFEACCSLAKATKVVSVTIPSGELGTPFNEEVEHLRQQVAIGAVEGVTVSIKSQKDCLSQDPDTVTVLCDNVQGLGLTLDPSQYLNGSLGGGIERLMKYVKHVHLRDSTKDEFQVRVGQGSIDYGRLVTHLHKFAYNGALSVNIVEQPDVDHFAELRKMRLLLESLL